MDFYVAAPKTSIDLTIAHGRDIVIEERNHCELTSINGEPIAAPGIGVWNPQFDVADAIDITGIVTEFGVATKGPGVRLSLSLVSFPAHPATATSLVAETSSADCCLRLNWSGGIAPQVCCCCCPPLPTHTLSLAPLFLDVLPLFIFLHPSIPPSLCTATGIRI